MISKMKNYMNTLKAMTLVLISMLFALPVISQQNEDNSGEIKTIFGKGRIEHGGYGAVTVGYTRLDNKDAILVGGRGGWIIDHSFTLGLAGYGIVSDLKYNDIFIDHYGNYIKTNLAGGYGGLLLEPIIMPRFPVHIAVPVIIGAGGIAYIDNYWNDDWNHDDNNNNVYDSDAYFVFEPGVEIEMNIVKFMRIGIGASYRYTSDIELQDTDKDILRGFNYGLSLKFGKF